REAEAGGLTFVISGVMPEGARFDFYGKDRREIARKEFISLCRAEAFMLAAIYMKNEGVGSLTATLCLHARSDGEENELCEEISAEKAEEFFARCVASLPGAARWEIERVTKRLPSMKGIKFPYGRVREGQNEFIRAAYRAISRGTRLFASAPTGTGKTVSALFPAIRALGDGRCEKAFYLTPKTTTAIAAKECIELMCERGAFIRAVILTAKEKLCARGVVCREGKRLCPTYRQNKLPEAIDALCELCLPVITAREISEAAARHNVCPHELALSYSEVCDIVICDFNYLFDPKAYIRRFFTRGGAYALLVDEAHNLPERAREMWSAEITDSALLAEELSSLFGEDNYAVAELHRANDAFRNTLMPLLRDEIRHGSDGSISAAYHTRDLPSVFYTLFGSLSETLGDLLYETFGDKGELGDMRRHAVRDLLYKITEFADAVARFDDHFELFVFLEGDALRTKIFCTDTSGVIAERLALGRGAVLFSGTLSPIDYYRTVLGGDRSDTVLTVDSPFETDQLSVCIVNTMTTRISEREKSLGAICSAIAATLSARRGNYMIFSPSFAYSEALYNAFVKKYPKIHAILQRSGMSPTEKEKFLSEFSADGKYLAAYCVTGGIFSEGIDLVGERLIGAVVVGIGMPALSYEREAIAAYYQDKLDEGREYAYLYPGMNRVLQAAGRVIRSEDDRGVIVLIDDRFSDPLYKKTIPKLWGRVKFIPDARTLNEQLRKFWEG
ncbi:MAG: ATP-dependent DNA helicase, partial [Clostridia bacterium]|nr:ATP-dependent DNA helicase [Clostridia bacterium]